MSGVQARAAFEIEKGPRDLLFLSEAEVAASLDPAALLDALEGGFADLSAGRVQAPPRPELTVPGKGFSLAMSAWRPGGPLCVKVVNVYDGNLDLGLPNHLALIQLFDADTGLALAVLDGTCITGLRTAASAVLSARLLARPDATVAAVIGAGVQGREHLRLLSFARPFERILVASLRYEDAERLAALHPRAIAVRSSEEAATAADVLCLCSHAPEPVIEAAWVRPGAHVSSVGYWPPRGELPRNLAAGQRLFVETRDAFAPAPVGCGELAGLDAAAATELGEVVLGRRPGRRTAEEITVYKAMGVAMEDLVAADLAYRSAVAAGRGLRLTW